MARKTGGLAALMSGQPVVVKKRRTVFWRLKLLTRQGGLHVGLILVCVLYVYGGAMLFMWIEAPEELALLANFTRNLTAIRQNFLENVENLKIAHQNGPKKNGSHLEASLNRLLDNFSHDLMKMFPHPVAANMFENMFFGRGENSSYQPLWNTDSSLLFTATTIVPVGYGYIAPLTTHGRLILCIYAGFGIPLALVMMSDVGKFLADLSAKLFNENITAFMVVLVSLLVAYSILGGIAMAKAIGVSMIDGIYFSTITIFTIGYGDVSPSISVYYIIAFIVFGVSLVTIAVDVVAANIIHNIHYMGRQVGKARIIADKMLMASSIDFQKIIRSGDFCEVQGWKIGILWGSGAF
ncbi:unnamed protein product [Caenorhabditis angaria]|uniref:Potassium channel domain-containing protein n=1 Tax=Caenorhabditis angaria TaxID=860376 RepID=A0A9P1IVB8_9PELO|nr:unnamed protein product [Caenorhabditis angaria]